VFPCHSPTAHGCSCRKDCGRIGKHPRTQHGLKDATTDEATIRRWWKQFPQANIGIATGARSGLVVLDEDTYKGGEQSRLDLEQSYSPIPETVLSLTGGGGVQYLFVHPGVHVKNGVETLGTGLDMRGDGGYIIAPPSLHMSGKHYTWEVLHEPEETPLAPMPRWLLALCQEQSRRQAPSAGEPIPKGQRNDALFKFGCSLRAKGGSEEVIRAALLTMNATQCQPPLDEAEVHTIAASCAKYEAGQVREDATRRRNGQTPHEGITTYLSRQKNVVENSHAIRAKLNSHVYHVNHVDSPWPRLPHEALYGLAGDYVHAIEPQSESDPAALLIQFLTTFGVVIGRHRYFQVEATRHYPNIFAVVAGLTSRARKGTSYSRIEAQMHAADCTWTRANHIKGCGSGEGLIYAVRDKRMGREPVKEKGRIIDYQEVELDPGVEDKRGLYQTGEFSSILKVAAREGNTLSEVIRDIWDTGYLRNMTKGNPLTATEAHIGIIGHITIEEIRKLMTSVDMANGFANRFIWICAKRSKELPDSDDIPRVDVAPLLKQLHNAVTFGKGEGHMQRDPEAKAAWRAVYGMLSEDRTGLANTVLARAEAQVLRLSMLYALLDASATITQAHLNAALALWQYAEDSAAYIFGEATGDETADMILDALEKAGEHGLSKNTIVQEVFQRNIRAAEITRALHVLEQQGRITSAMRPPEGGGAGRPSEVFTLSPNVVNVVNVVMPNRYLRASNEAVKAIAQSADFSRDNYVVIPYDAHETAQRDTLSPCNVSPDGAHRPFIPDGQTQQKCLHCLQLMTEDGHVWNN
jgi:hypothetical protein